ncbi:MAG: hypothetical protein ACTSRI_18780 [Promethearchaeota archaeon]
MSETKSFEMLLNSLKFEVSDYLVLNELTEYQKEEIDNATIILKDNIVGEVKKLGGNLKKNEEKFKQFVNQAERELEKDDYKDIRKEFKNHVKKLRELITKSCVAIIPVKEMPWVDVIFRTNPRIIFEKKKAHLRDNAISYHGEIKSIISKPTIYGKMKNAEPLFAPLMGALDLESQKFNESQEGSLSQNFPYINAIMLSLDSVSTRSQLVKYHEGYQRHGEPICDYLMKDSQLMKVMEKVFSGIESKRLNLDMAVCGIAIPQLTTNTTLLLITDESSDSNRFTKCFEALLRFSAACCEAPPSCKTNAVQQSSQMPQAAQSQASATSVLRTPGGQELKVWSQEELAEASQKRTTSIPSGMEVWSQEGLGRLAEKRGNGLPEGMEVWKEEELTELASKRQGGLNIPEWKPDQELNECSKCGYSLRPGWSKCPICDTPVSKPDSPPNKEPEQKSTGQDKTE